MLIEKASATVAIGGGTSVAAGSLLDLISGNEAFIGLIFAGIGLLIQWVMAVRKDARDEAESAARMLLLEIQIEEEGEGR